MMLMLLETLFLSRLSLQTEAARLSSGDPLYLLSGNDSCRKRDESLWSTAARWLSSTGWVKFRGSEGAREQERRRGRTEFTKQMSQFSMIIIITGPTETPELWPAELNQLNHHGCFSQISNTTSWSVKMCPATKARTAESAPLGPAVSLKLGLVCPQNTERSASFKCRQNRQKIPVTNQ